MTGNQIIITRRTFLLTFARLSGLVAAQYSCAAVTPAHELLHRRRHMVPTHMAPGSMRLPSRLEIFF